MMTMDFAPIYEVFSGIQGEGPLVGLRQIFIRFCMCNLRCRYCDTTAARRMVREARLEIDPGSREFERVINPLNVDTILQAVHRLNLPTGLHHSVSLTGGEPLLHFQFLERFLPPVRKAGLKIYLETNGTLPASLAKIIDLVDIVAMDIKLPSATGQRARYKTHKKFLQIASQKECIVKVVFCAHSTPQEMRRVGRLVATVDSRSILVLQPVTPKGGCIPPPTPEQMLEFQRILKGILQDVRVIPQVHKLMEQL